jgi:hypothetical protein
VISLFTRGRVLDDWISINNVEGQEPLDKQLATASAQQVEEALDLTQRPIDSRGVVA